MFQKTIAESKKVPSELTIDQNETSLEELTLLTPTTLAFFESNIMPDTPTTNLLTTSSIPTSSTPDLLSHNASLGGYPSEEDSDVTTSECSVVPATTTSSSKNKALKRKLPGPRPAYSDDELTPEDMQRRLRRRERNKMAASRCRQRRVDQTNELLNETKSLELEGGRLEKEIEGLEKLKQRLEVVLHSHLPLCSANIASTICNTLHNNNNNNNNNMSNNNNNMSNSNLNTVVEIKPLTTVSEGTESTQQKPKVIIIKSSPNNAFRPATLTTQPTAISDPPTTIINPLTTLSPSLDLLQTPTIKTTLSLSTSDSFDCLTPSSLVNPLFSPHFINN